MANPYLTALRQRYLTALALPGAAVAGVAACAGSGGVLQAPLAEVDASAPPAVATVRFTPVAPPTARPTDNDPPEPERPAWATGSNDVCPDEVETPDPPDFAAPFESCPAHAVNGAFSARATRAARTKTPEACCYVVFSGRPMIIRGRPLTSPEGARVAAVAPTGDWQEPLQVSPDTRDLSARLRRALAAEWRTDAQYEHAAIASFGRFALELMELGAPPELVDAAHAAARDEVAHARVCFALASAYAGKPLGPGPLAMPPPRETSLELLAAHTFVEGCAGETLAAAMAFEAAHASRDPVVARVLRRIARDEERHADLAWRTCAWALRVGGERVRRALLEAAQGRPTTPRAAAEGLDAYGCLSTEARRAIAEQAWNEVVLPCAATLTGQRAPMRAGGSRPEA